MRRNHTTCVRSLNIKLCIVKPRRHLSGCCNTLIKISGCNSQRHPRKTKPHAKTENRRDRERRRPPSNPQKTHERNERLHKEHKHTQAQRRRGSLLILIDSYGWIEYFAEGSPADNYAPSIEKANAENTITPTIVVYEVYRKIKNTTTLNTCHVQPYAHKTIMKLKSVKLSIVNPKFHENLIVKTIVVPIP